MKDLAICLVQSKIEWHNPDFNMSSLSKYLETVEKTDLIVLPEMWNTGFTMKNHLFYQRADEAVSLMKDVSLQKQAMVIGSIIVKENDDYFNRAFIVSEGRILDTYDKRHLFALSGEDRFFKSGTERKIVNLKDWRLCINICYDLRFPVWTRNRDDYDVLIYSANWPIPRIEAWNKLLAARAIENQAYVIGVNCFGEDVWHNQYSGCSQAVSYEGDVMDKIVDKAGTINVNFNKDQLDQYKASFPFLKEKDQFKFI